MGAQCATRTTQHSVPPFLKKPNTESCMYDSFVVPKCSTNSPHVVSRVASFIGPFWVSPTKPVMRVFAIEIGGGAPVSNVW